MPDGLDRPSVETAVYRLELIGRIVQRIKSTLSTAYHVFSAKEHSMKVPLFLIIFFWSVNLFAQDNRGLSRGSADQWRDSMDASIAWRDAKKISLLDPVPSLPQPTQDGNLDPDAFAKGQTGKVSYWNFKVSEIVDEKNMILALGSKHRIWVEGYPTSDLVDGQAVRIVDYVEILGTKSYATVVGSKATVWIIKPLPKEETEKRIAEELEFRVWTAKNKNKVNGKFVELKNSKVTIEQRNGKKITFPTSSLIDSDRELVTKLAKEKKSPSIK
jgi:hypothetical protein